MSTLQNRRKGHTLVLGNGLELFWLDPTANARLVKDLLCTRSDSPGADDRYCERAETCGRPILADASTKIS